LPCPCGDLPASFFYFAQGLLSEYFSDPVCRHIPCNHFEPSEAHECSALECNEIQHYLFGYHVNQTVPLHHFYPGMLTDRPFQGD
jgi:hypothetical protein